MKKIRINAEIMKFATLEIEPVAIYQMSRDLRTKEKSNTQQGWINDGKIERLWDGMTDIPFDEDEDGDLYISRDYGPFHKGESREYIWHWFDEKHSKGIHYLLYEREGPYLMHACAAFRKGIPR